MVMVSCFFYHEENKKLRYTSSERNLLFVIHNTSGAIVDTLFFGNFCLDFLINIVILKLKLHYDWFAFLF